MSDLAQAILNEWAARQDVRMDTQEARAALIALNRELKEGN